MHAAREAGDRSWIKEVHGEFARQVKRLPAPTPKQQLFLDVSLLHVWRTDGLLRTSNEYVQRVEKIVRSLERLTTYLAIQERVGLLVGLRADLNLEIDRHIAEKTKYRNVLIELLLRSGKLLIAHEQDIERQLRHLHPKFFGPLDVWHGYRAVLDKAKIEQLGGLNLQELSSSFDRYFSNKRERAELLEQQDRTVQAIHEWLTICDDTIAYHDQSPPHERLYFSERYRNVALSAFDRAQSNMNQLKHYHENHDLLVGMAFFELAIRGDRQAAAHWMSILKGYDFTPDHYAPWLREQYRFVCKALGYEKLG